MIMDAAPLAGFPSDQVRFHPTRAKKWAEAEFCGVESNPGTPLFSRQRNAVDKMSELIRVQRRRDLLQRLPQRRNRRHGLLVDRSGRHVFRSDQRPAVSKDTSTTISSGIAIATKAPELIRNTVGKINLPRLPIRLTLLSVYFEAKA